MNSDLIILILLVSLSLLTLGMGLYFLYAKEEHLVKNMEKRPNPEADAFCEKHGITRIQYTRAIGRLFLAWSPVFIGLYYLVFLPKVNAPKDEFSWEMVTGALACFLYLGVTYYYFIFVDTKKKDY